MKKKNSRRVTTILTIFALMMLLIPAGALFAESIDGGLPSDPGETTESVEMTEAGETEETDLEEAEEAEELDTEEASERAIYVAERNEAAALLGIPAGHLNLIDKLAAASGLSREATLLEWQDADIQDIAKAISRYRFEAKGKEVPPGLVVKEPETSEEVTVDEIVTEESSKGKAKGKSKHN